MQGCHTELKTVIDGHSTVLCRYNVFSMNCSDVLSVFKGNGAVGSSPAEDGSTDFAGGNTYVRFDVPKPKIKRSWPGIKGGI